LPSINPVTRIGEAEIEIKKWDKAYSIILGTSIKTEFIKKTEDDAFTVPQSALKQLASGYVLYRLDSGQVREVPVETGIKSNNQVQIVKGLSEGEKVAVSNIDKLYDGAKVYVFEGEEQ
jgi:multidrug efflux pump subunit AcrA (membrane-fusion protein)